LFFFLEKAHDRFSEKHSSVTRLRSPLLANPGKLIQLCRNFSFPGGVPDHDFWKTHPTLFFKILVFRS